MTMLRCAEAADAEQVVRILADAFMEDPVSCWLFPERAEREEAHPGFFRIFVHSALATGRIEIADGGGGVALWQPIDACTDLEVDADQYRQAFEPVCGADATRRIIALSRASAQRHPRQEPQEYLPLIAVHRDQRGRGIGTALLRHRLAALDGNGTAAYLEATSPRSCALYERFGFSPYGAPIELPDGPSVVPMWRPPSG